MLSKKNQFQKRRLNVNVDNFQEKTKKVTIQDINHPTTIKMSQENWQDNGCARPDGKRFCRIANTPKRIIRSSYPRPDNTKPNNRLLPFGFRFVCIATLVSAFVA